MAVVARNEHPRGYMDLKSDDIDEDPMLKEWSKLSRDLKQELLRARATALATNSAHWE